MNTGVFFHPQNVSEHLRYRRACVGLVGLFAAVLTALAGGCKGPVDDEAHKVWLQKRGSAQVVVLPVIVRRGRTIEHDADAAAAIVDFVNTKGFGTARLVDVRITPGPWNRNQARILGESAAAIGEWRKGREIADADYVVTVETLFMGGTGELGGVHLYVVDAEGRFADGVLLNSHHEIFRQRKSKDVGPCVSMVLDAWKMDYPDEPAK